MPQSFPLKNKVSVGVNRQVAFKTLSAQFGDGYEQRAPNGINNRVETISIKWEALTKADFTTVVTALDAVGGWDYLTFTPHGESTEKRYKLKDGAYSTSYSTSGDSNILLYSVECVLVQVF